MWDLQNPWWEYILRAFIIYAAVFALLRVVGKKQIGEMSPFDLVLLLIISEAVSAAITGGDESIGAGLIAVASFVLTNYLVDWVTYKSKKIEKILDGEAQLLVVDGKVQKKIQDKELITNEEIASVLREHGLNSLQQVAYGILETNGQISIIRKQANPTEEDSQVPHQDTRLQ